MNTSATVTRLTEFADSVSMGGKLANRYTKKHRDGTATVRHKGFPILQCVKLSRKAHHMEIRSTNLEKHERSNCYCNTRGMGELPEKGEAWDICIPFDPLNDWLKALPRDKTQELTLTVNRRTQIMTVSYVNGITMTATFKGIDAMEFPDEVDSVMDKGET